MGNPEGTWRKTTTITAIVFLASLVYAVVRYHIVRTVPLDHLPLYTVNKAIAMSATIIIGLSYVLGPLARFFPKTFVPHLPLRKDLGITGFAVAAVHAVISLLLFGKAYYPRFFLNDGKLTMAGEFSMLFGILAFMVFASICVTSLPDMEKRLHPAQWKLAQRMGYIAYVFVLLHAAIMGYRGWFQADAWQYGMASITLISSLFIILVLLLRLIVIAFPRK